MYENFAAICGIYLASLQLIPMRGQAPAFNAALFKAAFARVGNLFQITDKSGKMTDFYSLFDASITSYTDAISKIGSGEPGGVLIEALLFCYSAETQSVSAKRLVINHFNFTNFSFNNELVKDVTYNGKVEEYTLENDSGEMTALPLDPGLVLVTGLWREGKSTLTRHLNFKYTGTKPYYYDNAGAKVEYTDTMKFAFIGEPEHGSIPFSMEALDIYLESSTQPLVVDSFTKGELYIDVIAYKNAVSKAVLAVADRCSLRSHIAPTVIAGFTALPEGELIGSSSNVIVCSKIGDNAYAVKLLTRSGKVEVYRATLKR